MAIQWAQLALTASDRVAASAPSVDRNRIHFASPHGVIIDLSNSQLEDLTSQLLGICQAKGISPTVSPLRD